MESIFTNIKNVVPREAIFLLIGLLVLIIIAFIILKITRLNFAKKEFDRLEERFVKIKGIPLTFKLSKASALSRVNESLDEKLRVAEKLYEKIEQENKQISILLGEMDDALYAKKHRLVLTKSEKVEEAINNIESKVNEVDLLLDEILRSESEKREQINRLKEQFRILKQKIGIDKTKYYQGVEYIEKTISNIEKMFTLFEEWMFASEFEKATQQYEEIKDALFDFNHYIEQTPFIFSIIHTKLQKQMDSLSYVYASYKNEGIYIEHLGIKNNLDLVANVIKESITKLSKGQSENIKEELEKCEIRLAQLSEQLLKEHEAFKEIQVLQPAVSQKCFELKTTTQKLTEMYNQYHVRFSLENYDSQIQEFDSLIQEIELENAEINNEEISNNPATKTLIHIKQLQEKCENYDLKISQLKNLLQSVLNDEKRAYQQLLKLNLTVHEMGIKLSSAKLDISDTKYETDIKTAKAMLNDIQNLIDASIVDVEKLNAKIKDSIDFIYTLYNDISKYVGTALMVENLIVFGNKYRSTYLDLNSELIRGEIYYSNKEYTKALQIVVNAIEKIVPGIYEKMLAGKVNKG